jgi:hypothetical protein
MNVNERRLSVTIFEVEKKLELLILSVFLYPYLSSFNICVNCYIVIRGLSGVTVFFQITSNDSIFEKKKF